MYQGHHGDVGAQYADVVLPGCAYTEKSTTWVNTEGRTQLGRAAVPPPGAAREDWKIVRALSEVVGATLPYDDTGAVRDRMWDVCPSLVRYGELERPSSVLSAVQALHAQADAHAAKAKSVGGGLTGAFKKPIASFYRTDAVSRNSTTMGHCVQAFDKGDANAGKNVYGDDGMPQKGHNEARA